RAGAAAAAGPRRPGGPPGGAGATCVWQKILLLCLRKNDVLACLADLLVRHLFLSTCPLFMLWCAFSHPFRTYCKLMKRW
ncbi:MAG: hypothetical protein RMJ98_15325, partial [Myxococcales bacterium]|nr:hypothetical protein [Myxococcales bacterium]